MTDTERVSGSVKMMQKTFGFIRGDDHFDRFIHRDDIGHKLFEQLDIGMRVSFVSEETDRGPRALEVKMSVEAPTT
jgi:cold shock CspA family protein